MKSMINFQSQQFSGLTLPDWYAISQAREQVFIVEQNCAYLDSDGQDTQAWHITGRDVKTNNLACYARILPPTVHFSTGEFANLKMPAIGRVLTVSDYRGQGLANDLMKFAIAQSREQFGNMQIYISAQVYLLKFYQGLGFLPQGDRYLEDGIPHQDMVLLSV